jgi:uncharacterized protein YdiU (UPF0061 family)
MVVSNKTQVVRDKLYSGNPIKEKCAVVMRVAPTFLRFGSFEIFSLAKRTKDKLVETSFPLCHLRTFHLQKSGWTVAAIQTL